MVERVVFGALLVVLGAVILSVRRSSRRYRA
jgi:hypothetical protein